MRLSTSSAQGFAPVWYIDRYPDVAASGADPLTHYLAVGWQRGYRPNAVFDPTWYLNRYPDVRASSIEPFTHYATVGWRENRNPHALFDTRHYRKHHLPIRRRGLDPLAHYLTDGWQDSASPHPLFDPTWYRSAYTDIVPIDCCPLAHFVEHGEALGLEPSPGFDSQAYRKSIPTGMLDSMSPIEHFIAASGESAAPVTTVRIPRRYVHAHQRRIGGIDAATDLTRVAIIACHDGRRRIGAVPSLLAQSFKSAGFTVILSFDSDLDDLDEGPDAVPPECDLILASDHAGYDFYSWRLALEYLNKLMRAEHSMARQPISEIILMNDSVIGPLFDFADVLHAWRSLPFDVTGLVESNQLGAHLQSWAIRFSGEAANTHRLLSFYGKAPARLQRHRAIRDFEVPLADAFREHGFTVGSVFSPVSTGNPEANPSVNEWCRMLRAGVPFVKRNVFTYRGLDHDSPHVALARLENEFDLSPMIDVDALVQDSLAQIGVEIERNALMVAAAG